MEIWKAMFLVLVLACVSFAGLSVTSWEVSQSEFTPGSNGIITLTISNPFVTGAVNRPVTSVNMDIYSPPELIMTGKQFVGDIESGGATSISIPFRVGDNASSAIYTVDFKVTGIADKSDGGGYEMFSRSAIVPVTVVERPVLRLQSDKDLIGGIDTVLLTVINEGGPASNLKIKIPTSTGAVDVSTSTTASTSSTNGTTTFGSQTSPVAFLGVDQIFISRIEKGGSVSVNVTLDSRSAPDGATNVPFYLEYDDELGITHTGNTALRLTVRNEKLDLQFIQQGDVITRKEGTMTLQIKNSGTETLKDVRLTFQDTGLRLSDRSELKFGDVAPGATATASGIVFAELPPGLNLVPAELTWIEKDVQREESRSIPITITSDADVGVYLEARPLPLTVGTEHTISVLISNLGSYNIENVEVEFSSPVLRSMDISDKQYIGGLQKDDFSTVQFLVNVNATAPGTYPADIRINYRDQSGEWKTKSVVQDISVYNGTAQESDPLPLVIGGLVVAAILIWFFRFRKK
jgi:hypothetical protein